MKKAIGCLLTLMVVTLTVVQGQMKTASGETIDGSPYLDDAYADGVIYYADKELSAPIRYNAYQDLIEYQSNGKPLVLDPKPNIRQVVVGNTTFVPMKYNAEGTGKLGYFTLLESGKVSLYVRKSVIFLPAKKGGALDGSDQPPQFKRSVDEFYVQVGDGGLEPMGNIKSFIGMLPAKQDEMKQYAKKEKISPRKEQEVVQLVKYYNSL